MKYEPVDKDTVEEFIGYLRLSEAHWGEGLPRSSWVFRGMADAEWHLVPSAQRDVKDRSSFFACICAAQKSVADCQQRKLTEGLTHDELQGFNDNPERAGEAFVVNAAERYGVENFLALVDEQGFRVPGEFGPTHAGSHFSFWPQVERSEKTLHPAFALAQHHGCSTRLLDWTWNPLAAAFFAADDVKEGVTDGRLAVWALHVSALNDGNWRRFEVPGASVKFLHAQQGLFSFHRVADQEYVRTGRWPQLDGEVPTAKLRRITLPRVKHGQLLFQLFRERISRAHVMPTLDNVKVTIEKMLKYQMGLG